MQWASTLRTAFWRSCRGIVLTARDSGGACPRKGLVMAFDLEDYDYHLGSASAIRPTEKTVEERIPPRLAVREGAASSCPISCC